MATQNYPSHLSCFKHPNKKVEAVCVQPDCCYYRFFCTKCFIENLQHLTSHHVSIIELPALLSKHHEQFQVCRSSKKKIQNEQADLMKDLAGTLNDVTNIVDRHKTFAKQAETKLVELLDSLKVDFKNSVDMIRANFSDTLQSTILKYENKYDRLVNRIKELSSSAKDIKDTPQLLSMDEVDWRNQNCVESFFMMIAHNRSGDSAKKKHNFQEESAKLTEEIENIMQTHEMYFRDNKLMDSYAIIQETIKELGTTIKKKTFEVRELILHNPQKQQQQQQQMNNLIRQGKDLGDQEEEMFSKETRKKVKKDVESAMAVWQQLQTENTMQEEVERLRPVVLNHGNAHMESERKSTLKKPFLGKSGGPKVSPFRLMLSKDMSEALQPAWADKPFLLDKKQSSSKKRKLSNGRNKENISVGMSLTGSKKLAAEDSILNNCLLAMGLTPLVKSNLNDTFERPKKISKDFSLEDGPAAMLNISYNWKESSMLNVMSPLKSMENEQFNSKQVMMPTMPEIKSHVQAYSPKKVSLRESNFYLDSVSSSHREGITSIAVIKGHFATGSFDNTIKLWDMYTFQPVKTLKGHKSWVTCLASTDFDPKVEPAYSTTGSYIDQGSMMMSMPHSAVMRDGGPEFLLISAGLDFEIKIWDPFRDQPELGSLKGHYQMVTALKTFKYANRLLVSASRDKNIKVWDLRTNQCIYTKAEHNDWVTCLEVFHSKSYLVSGSNDRSIMVWKLVFTDENTLQKCALKCRFNEAHQKSVQSLAASRDEKYLISSGEDGTLKLWDIDRGACIREMYSQKKVPMFRVLLLEDLLVDCVKYPSRNTLSYLENEERVVEECAMGMSITGEVHIWDIATGEEIIVCDNGHRYKNVEFPFGDVLKLDNKVKYWKGLLSQEYNMVSVANGNGVMHLWKF